MDAHLACIAVNARLLIPEKLEGIGKVKQRVLSRMVHNHPNTIFHFLFDRPYTGIDFEYPNVVKHIIAPKARHPILWLMWFEFGVRRALKKIKPSAYLSLEGFGQLFSATPTVVMLHDINFHYYPNHLAWSHQFFYNFFFPKYANKAKKVLTVSHFCKHDIAQTWNIDTAKIEVVYNGADPILNNHVLISPYTQPYFLFIGSINPRKNLENQIKAFELYKQHTNSEALFVIAGESKWGDAAFKVAEQSVYKADIIFLGRISDLEYQSLLKHTQALLYVSFFEGFGLPVVEAMSLGVPVITSTTSALPEIAGDAALFCSPNNIQNISDAMLQLEDAALRAALIQKGYERAQKFNWDTAEAQIWNHLLAVC